VDPDDRRPGLGLWKTPQTTSTANPDPGGQPCRTVRRQRAGVGPSDPLPVPPSRRCGKAGHLRGGAARRQRGGGGQQTPAGITPPLHRTSGIHQRGRQREARHDRDRRTDTLAPFTHLSGLRQAGQPAGPRTSIVSLARRRLRTIDVNYPSPVTRHHAVPGAAATVAGEPLGHVGGGRPLLVQGQADGSPAGSRSKDWLVNGGTFLTPPDRPGRDDWACGRSTSNGALARSKREDAGLPTWITWCRGGGDRLREATGHRGSRPRFPGHVSIGTKLPADRRERPSVWGPLLGVTWAPKAAAQTPLPPCRAASGWRYRVAGGDGWTGISWASQTWAAGGAWVGPSPGVARRTWVGVGEPGGGAGVPGPGGTWSAGAWSGAATGSSDDLVQNAFMGLRATDSYPGAA
jgi:hypothetical protein